MMKLLIRDSFLFTVISIFASWVSRHGRATSASHGSADLLFSLPSFPQWEEQVSRRKSGGRSTWVFLHGFSVLRGFWCPVRADSVLAGGTGYRVHGASKHHPSFVLVVYRCFFTSSDASPSWAPVRTLNRWTGEAGGLRGAGFEGYSRGNYLNKSRKWNAVKKALLRPAQCRYKSIGESSPT